ncbi:hypothetical protein [Thermus brockianus]|uniref:Uncharacterized protein n=1 Tax=Thermus brockianus TaxID=56956 RepID=A0ABN6NKB5_THEBO|nr:hypothetical protein [Thermus brockianus]BDG17430.1 hypothetical protein TbrSNM41_21640 [Thermus brockianus]
MRLEERASLYATGELWVDLGRDAYLWVFAAGAGKPESYLLEGKAYTPEILDSWTYRVRLPPRALPGEPYALWIRTEEGWYVRCRLFYPYPLRLPPGAEAESERIAVWLEQSIPPPFAVEIGTGAPWGEFSPEPHARTPLGWLRVRPLNAREASALRMRQAPPDLETYSCWPYGSR